MATPQVNGSAYVVQKGDNLSRIAKQHGTTVEALLKFNPGINGDKLSIGQTIQLTGENAEKARRHQEVMNESRAAIRQAIDYGYGEEYAFSIAQNGDIILTLRTPRTLGEIRGDFQIEEGSLSRTNNIKGKNSKYQKPPVKIRILNSDVIRGRNYDELEIPEGDTIVVERYKFRPNPSKTTLGRAWDRFKDGFSKTPPL